MGLTIDGKMIHQLAVQYSEFDIKIIGWGYEFWRYVEISSFAWIISKLNHRYAQKIILGISIICLRLFFFACLDLEQKSSFMDGHW